MQEFRPPSPQEVENICVLELLNTTQILEQGQQ
jgi:hypothetical protein